ncbi:MAG: phage tail tube protein [Nitrospiraceae bacterium]
MASQAIAAYGLLLQRKDPNTNLFATVAEVKSVNGPNIQVSEIDVTTHSSAAGGPYKEFIPSLIEVDFSFGLNFVPSLQGHKDILSDIVQRRTLDYQMIYPDTGATVWGFRGFAKGFNISSETDGVLEADVDFRITGAITLPS